jgi:hypothetical protein
MLARPAGNQQPDSDPQHTAPHASAKDRAPPGSESAIRMILEVQWCAAAQVRRASKARAGFVDSRIASMKLRVFFTERSQAGLCPRDQAQTMVAWDILIAQGGPYTD